MKNLVIAVVGVGHMGRFHCQKVAALHDAGEGVDLVGVVDLDRERGEAVALECQSSYFAKPEEVFGLADAVIVAVPSATEVTEPDEETVATDAADDVHETLAPLIVAPF